MTIDAAQLSVVVGVAVAMLMQVLKRVIPGLNTSDATVKQVTVAVLAFIGALATGNWSLDGATLTKAAVAALVAWATHKGLLKQPEEIKPVGRR